MTLRHYIQSLRFVALIEGFSWLTLIGAMIYEAKTGNHEPVSWAGRVHGGLFTLFALILFLTWLEGKWKIAFATLIGLTSLIPLGFLIGDPLLKKKLASLG